MRNNSESLVPILKFIMK